MIAEFSTRQITAAAFVLMASLVWLPSAAHSGPSRAAKAQAEINWPHFRFDDKHTGYQPFETALSADNIEFAGLSWQAQLGEPVSSSSPAVVDGIVYIASRDGVLWAYPADGCGQTFCATPLWQSAGLAQIVDSPAVANGMVYIGSQTSPDSNDGKLNAFASTGCGQAVCAPLWQGDAGPEAILESSPAVWKGLVFVGAFDGKIYAFNAEGCGQALCQPVWTGQTGGSVESTPTVYKGVLFIGSNDGKLYAFRAKGCRSGTCKPIWDGCRGQRDFPVHASRAQRTRLHRGPARARGIRREWLRCAQLRAGVAGRR